MTSGVWHPCGDYHMLNNATASSRPLPLPSHPGFSIISYGATIFLKLDLVHAYHHIPVEPVDIHKTAVTIPFGLFEFLWMPFGLQNAAQTFQCLVDQVLHALHYRYNYSDDLLIASPKLRSTSSTYDWSLKESVGMVSLSIQLSVSLVSPSCSSWDIKLIIMAFNPWKRKCRLLGITPSPQPNTNCMSYLGWSNFTIVFFPVQHKSYRHSISYLQAQKIMPQICN